MMQSMCIRNGCTNPTIESPGWDNEYCSNECVVNHCRSVLAQAGYLGGGGGHVVPTQTLSLEVICEIHKVQKL